jgi:acyl-CoA synthetase (AMP-forming)/AMP-acid ligase II
MNSRDELTLVETIRRHASGTPDAVAFIFLRDGEIEQERITFGELDRKVSLLAASLLQKSNSGAPALLLYSTGSAFIYAFLACLYAGIVAVPVNVPRRRQSPAKLISILRDCQAKLVLTETDLINDLSSRFDSDDALRGTTLLVTDGALSALAAPLPPTALDPEALAFLQYTSGSTGHPKGVMVSHRNIMANQRMICEAFGHSAETVFVGWLPFHHDMGLVGNVMQPLYLGIPSVMMSAAAFVQKPIRWLKAISTYKATTSGGPNFAYDQCVRRCSEAELEGLDLSSWKVAFNGAEPVRADTIAQFEARFQKHGFSSTSFYPCYGMAEATLFIAGGIAGARPVISAFDTAQLEDASLNGSPARARAIVGCGFGRLDQQVIIVNPATRLECPPGKIGEIWVRGPNIARNYLRADGVIADCFAGRLADSGDGPFLQTGDLGLMHEENLYVTGRLKELIILRGRNIYPHDIERTVAESHPALHGCEGAAFSVDVNGEEKLVVIHEISRTYLNKFDSGEIMMSVREKLAADHDVGLHDLTLVRPLTIPKTSSGKTQRNVCQDLYVQRQLNRLQAA